MSQGKPKKEKPAIDPIERTRSLRLLALAFGLSFLHLFWYGSPWTAWLGLICYAPFIAWLQNHSRRPFLAGLTFGYYYALMNTYWLAQFVGKWTQSLVVSMVVIFVVGGVWGCFYGFTCWLQDRFAWLRNFGFFAIALFITELARMSIPQLEFPFCPIGEPLVVYPTMTAILKNANFMTFFALLMNAFAAPLFRPGLAKRVQAFMPQYKQALIAFGACLVVALALPYIGTKPEPKPLGIRIALGQLGTDLAYGDEHTEASRVAQAGDDLSRQAIQQNADLLLFPEGVTAFRTTPFTPFSLDPNLKVIFGAQRGMGPVYQSAFLWDGHGFRYTDKKRLVVFGEYVPFRGIIPYPAGFQLPSGDLAAGTERHLLEVKPGVTVGAMICFESLFPTSAKEFDNLNASFLAIISLDDWYIGTNAIPRLEIAARWRAVETKKWIVRVGSLGKTMVIDPKGRVMAELPIGGRQLLVYDL